MDSRSCLTMRNLIPDSDERKRLLSLARLPEYRDLLQAACAVAVSSAEVGIMVTALSEGVGLDKLSRGYLLPVVYGNRDDFNAAKAKCLFSFKLAVALLEESNL